MKTAGLQFQMKVCDKIFGIAEKEKEPEEQDIDSTRCLLLLAQVQRPHWPPNPITILILLRNYLESDGNL